MLINDKLKELQEKFSAEGSLVIAEEGTIDVHLYSFDECTTVLLEQTEGSLELQKGLFVHKGQSLVLGHQELDSIGLLEVN